MRAVAAAPWPEVKDQNGDDLPDGGVILKELGERHHCSLRIKLTAVKLVVFVLLTLGQITRPICCTSPCMGTWTVLRARDHAQSWSRSELAVLSKSVPHERKFPDYRYRLKQL